MQTALREQGVNHVGGTHHERFAQIHAEGKLVRPEQSGYVIASLAVGAGKEMSGKFVSWDDQDCAAFRRN